MRNWYESCWELAIWTGLEITPLNQTMVMMITEMISLNKEKYTPLPTVQIANSITNNIGDSIVLNFEILTATTE